MAESHIQRKRTGRPTAALLALLSVGTASSVSAQTSPSGTQELEEVVTRGMTSSGTRGVQLWFRY